MTTHNKSKVLVLVLVVVTLLAAVFLAPRFFTAQKLQAHVAAQLRQSVPAQRMYAGHEEHLQNVVVTGCQRSLKGDTFALKFELLYTGTLRVASGCVLVCDERGHYRGEWNTPDYEPVQFYIQ